jgi:hypothetical protein
MLSLFFSLVIAQVCLADLYQYTDNEGVVHFTDDPRKVPAKFRKNERADPDASLSPKESNMREVDNQKTIETLERKQAEMPPGQVLTEQDVRALLEARKRVGR